MRVILVNISQLKQVQTIIDVQIVIEIYQIPFKVKFVIQLFFIINIFLKQRLTACLLFSNFITYLS